MEAVLVKYLGEGGSDDRLEPVLVNGPDGVLTGGTAPEVRAGNKDARALVLRRVELEVGVRAPVFKPTPVEEQKLSISRALNALQKLLWDHLVRIDVRAVKYGYVGGMSGEWLHGCK